MFGKGGMRSGSGRVMETETFPEIPDSSVIASQLATQPNVAADTVEEPKQAKTTIEE